MEWTRNPLGPKWVSPLVKEIILEKIRFKDRIYWFTKYWFVLRFLCVLR